MNRQGDVLSTTGTESLRQAVLLTAPRILGLIDREAGSPTYGCGERNFWHYKLTDFPNARFQEASLLLALLYANDFTGNPYYGNRAVRRWALGMAAYWAGRLNRDGSATELYPFERSFCGTAFSTLAVSETLLVLGADAEAAEGAEEEHLALALAGVERAARWMEGRIGVDVANQAAAAMNALQNAALLTGRDALRRASEEALRALASAWERDGHFNEYGGFDLGYTTITMSCIALYTQKPGAPGQARRLLEAACRAVEPRFDECGNYDPAGMSRNTTYAYPFGFACAGSPVLGSIARGVAANAVLSPLWMDDRYCVPLAWDYLMAYLYTAAQDSARTEDKQ